MGDAPLQDVLVVELGRRLGVAACGSVLAELGATVVMLETEDDISAHGPTFAVGKRRITGTRDDDLVQGLTTVADVVLTSSDLDAREIEAGPIVCDLTAFGGSGPMAGAAYSEGQIQALAGIMETTGLADGPPVAIGAPVIELSTGLYAAAAVLAALRVRGASGRAQRIDMALYDVAVNTLSTFLPAHYGGLQLARLGNAHSLVCPWNAYRAADGWVLICCPSEPHWQRLCQVMDRADLVDEPAYANRDDRIAARAEIDQVVEAWTSGRSVGACVEALSAATIPSGPIVTVEALADDANIGQRRMVRLLDDPVTGQPVRVPGAWLRSSAWQSGRAERLSAPDADRAAVRDLVATRAQTPRGAGRETTPAPPLAGLRVLEVGQYTTAPLVGRHLATLGAEVTKIEPEGGDAGRLWSPGQGGLSYFFVFSNSDKESLALDLGSAEGAARFRELVRTADVLVENMKPGALARLGFAPEALAALNPRLVYCAISGFGADSAYPGRPAVDTIAQAMSGLMDLTRYRDVPLKSGISTADIVGGQCGLVAILAGLEFRQRQGCGAFLDLAMQDTTAWLTQGAWNGAPPTADDLQGVAVATVAEVVAHPQTAARQLIVTGGGEDGQEWPLLGSPLRLSLTPPKVAKPPGAPRSLAAARATASGAD